MSWQQALTFLAVPRLCFLIPGCSSTQVSNTCGEAGPVLSSNSHELIASAWSLPTGDLIYQVSILFCALPNEHERCLTSQFMSTDLSNAKVHFCFRTTTKHRRLMMFFFVLTGLKVVARVQLLQCCTHENQKRTEFQY